MTDCNESKCPLCHFDCQDVKKLCAPPAVLQGRVLKGGKIDTGSQYNCQVCGVWAITTTDRDHALLNQQDQDKTLAPQLSALLQERRIRRDSAVWLRFRKDEDYAELVDRSDHTTPSFVPMQASELRSRWPRTVAEKLNRTLRNLAGLSLKGGQKLTFASPNCGVGFASDMEELFYHLWSLEQQKLIGNVVRVGSEGISAIVYAEGWARIDELNRGPGSSLNPAFVAMWFGSKDRPAEKAEMTELFNEGMVPAVEGSSYRVIRVDREEHNDFIMDKVLGSIRLAPFVVADFTGNRGGVYLEAGFARGLGIPVIHTCKSEDFEKAHFDIQQINTIRWENPGDLLEKLHHRIRATIPEGPYKTGIPDPTAPSAT